MADYLENSEIIVLERTLLRGSPWVIQGSQTWGYAGWRGVFHVIDLETDEDGKLLAVSSEYVLTMLPIDQQTFLLNDPLSVFAAIVDRPSQPLYPVPSTWGSREHIQRWLNSSFGCDSLLIAANPNL